MNWLKVGLSILFLTLWGLSFFGIYKYLEWLFRVELLTTAGIVGLMLVFPILVGEFFLSIVIIGAFKGIISA